MTKQNHNRTNAASAPAPASARSSSHLALFLAALLLLSTPLFSQVPTLTGLCSSQSVQTWVEAMGAGLILMAVVIALVYMAGESLSLPRLLDWAKTEVLQMGMAIILFFLVIFLVNTECTLQMGQFLNWTGLGGGVVTASMTPMEAAQAYLNWGAAQTHLTVILIRRDMGALNIRATYTSYQSQGGFGGNGYTSSPYSGDWTTLGTLGMLLNFNSSFLLTILFEFFSLAFFASSNGLFLLLVPIGLVLRSVPFLRQFGGSLVAIAVGFYLFYPLMLALLGILLPPLYTSDASNVAQTISGGVVTDATNVQQSIDQAQANEQSLTGATIFSYFNTTPPVWMYSLPTAGLGEYFRLTALNFVRSILLPSVGLILSVSLVRDLSGLFGEEVDASRLVQLI